MRCAGCGAALPESSATTVVAPEPVSLSPALAETVAVEDAPPPEAGKGRAEVFGRFLVLDRLGEGAMGVVLAAYDPNLDRKVAIKVLRPGPDQSDSARARLLREAQAMAKLSHPNVVAVHEVGVAEDQVFIVMEHVQGRTLRVWLEEQPRPLRAVVDLFLQAGRGLAAAHRAGFVHRDFKPDNVLVDRDDRARVTDFGLVTALEGGGEEGPGGGEEEGAQEARAEGAAARSRRQGASLTSAGAVLGTPIYMAPEQHEGKAVDARADQFAFAVALYEALHGERPFAGETYEELRAAVLSGAVRDARDAPRRARVPAWIRAVLLRALRVDPAERYPSMDAMLAALGKDPAASRRRAAGIAAMAAVGGLAIAALVRGSAGDAGICKGAEQRLAGVWDEGVKDAVRAAMLATGRPYAEDTYRRVAAILDERAGAWAAMYTESCEATNVRGEQSAALLDLRTHCLDRRRAEIGALTALLSKGPDVETLNKAIEASLSLPKLDVCADAEALTAAVPPPTDPAARARVDGLFARVEEADVLLRTGQHQRGLEIAGAAAAEARDSGYAPVEARALLVQGRLQRDASDLKAAEATLRDAAIAAGKAKDDRLLASIWAELINVIGARLARHADALALESVALAAVERAGGDAELRAVLLNSLADVLSSKGDYKEALEKSRQAVELFEASKGSEDPGLAVLLNLHGKLLVALERYQEGQSYYERALALHEKVYGPDHPSVALVLGNLGSLFGRRGQNEAALSYIERSVAIFEKARGPDHPSVANVLNNMGLILTDLGRYEDARRCHERARSIWEKAPRPDHPNVGRSLNNIGYILDMQGKHTEAQPYYERALAVKEKSLGADSVDVANGLASLGNNLVAQDKLEQARAPLERSIAILEQRLGPSSLAVTTPLCALGEAYLGLKQPRKALGLLDRASAILERNAGEGDPYTRAATQFALARALWEVGRDRERALDLAARARRIYEEGGVPQKERRGRVEAWLKERAAVGLSPAPGDAG